MNDISAHVFPLSGNQLIEASAGTGKTYTITNLYIRLLLGRGRKEALPVNRILVLTFTIAATEELKHRIRKRIIEAKRIFSGIDSGDGGGTDSKDEFLLTLRSHSDDLDRDLRLLTAASLLMDEAAIFTIHGFCARVLDELSFETGVLFDQNLNADRDALLQIAAEDCFRKHILRLPDFERRLALKLWPNPELMIQKTKQFLFRESLSLEPDTEDVSDDYDLIGRNITTIQKLWVEYDIPALIRNAGFDKRRKPISRLETMTTLCESADPIAADNEVWSIYNQANLKNSLTKKGQMPEHAVFDLIDEVWAARRIIDQARTNLWHLVTRSLREEIAFLKASTNELTLDDLLVQLSQSLVKNPTLPGQLAERWPVAMIDEFQDTDNLQYDIFSRIYAAGDDNCLLFIGDPKQAIYQFRGADIYTYLNARQDSDDIHSLSTNWRSTKPMVEAINHLFSRTSIFGDENIHYTPNTPSANTTSMQLVIDNEMPAPCRISFLQGEKLSKTQARTLCMADAGENIVELLTSSDRKRATIDGKPINAGQIALLVRDKNDARAAQYALSCRGIKSVYVTLESVFLQDTAEDLRLVMKAVIDPTNDRTIKAALATTLLGTTAEEIDALNRDVVKHQQVLSEFKEYHELWVKRDIAPMIEAIVVRRQIAEKWLHRPGGERQLTNLRHLSELLQQRSSAAPGMHRLLKWFTREKNAAETVATEDRQLRLESDENLVKIVTMHAAKGLEYDIVMIPMAGFIAGQRSGEPALYHDVVDGIYETHLNFSPNEVLKQNAKQEKYEEDMRLLYVAITRARYLLYLGIPDMADLTNAAIGKMLGLSDKENRHLDYLNDHLPAQLFRVSGVTEPAVTRHEETFDASKLIAPSATPILNDTWRVHSYTGLSRNLNKLEEATDTFSIAGYGDDEEESAPTVMETQYSRFTFPRGPLIGIALHALLEDIDFGASEEEIASYCSRCMLRLGIQESEWLDVLSNWIIDIVHTPLGAGFSLVDIPDSDRINEMEFHYPVTINDEFLALAKQAGYLSQTTTEHQVDLSGMMTGLIDLIVRFNNKHYLIDYKSNYLGNTYDKYIQDFMQMAVSRHNYDLQYLIYCLALHRFLRRKISDYSYEGSFGGVRYLFLRGMQGAADGSTGVFSDLPPVELINELDQLVGSTH